jgi:DNA (cytosine-5)-methyltransferase 1
MPIDVIDLFAGPGGLGEGFASLNNGQSFKIAVSAEMEGSAHKTLTLRSYYRLALVNGDKRAMDAYYAYCNSNTAPHPSIVSTALWKEAAEEAQQLTLGESGSNRKLDEILDAKKLNGDNTILIGGPPCQAYSLVGRSRNLGKKNYVAEEDHRHFLYKEYLRIIAKARPAVFVMENVKGILSSKVSGQKVFPSLLKDLTNPAKAMGQKTGERYVIYSLSSEVCYDADMNADDIDPRSFIVRAEEYGIPQARHRVILLGIRESHLPKTHPLLTRHHARSVEFALQDLPKLRGRLSKNDSDDLRYDTVKGLGEALANDARKQNNDLAEALKSHTLRLEKRLPIGADRLTKQAQPSAADVYLKWVRDADSRLAVWLHHEARSHMASDLGRYFYASIFTKANGRSPKGHADFSLSGLAPAHANWNTGKFADRFRVQGLGHPSTTITSHIAKDGHYFIHPDPLQCRSLTVREAARLQTFKDNYFFEGNRTQKYHQVGNAVPPLLARSIAEVCGGLFKAQRPQKAPIDD